MSDTLREYERALVPLLADSVRGPRRNGVFSLWLVVRMCDRMLPPDPISLRSHRRCVAALEKRLSSLSLSPALRRAFQGALRKADEGTPRSAAVALKQLVAPVAETLGKDCAELVAGAARDARSSFMAGRAG